MSNICPPDSSRRARRSLDKALNTAVAFFRDGNQLDICDICRQIADILPSERRCETIEFCMKVARVKGFVSPEELGLIKNLSSLLEIDGDTFQTMLEKILPVTIHQVKNAELTLGISAQMDKDRTRRHLNSEYRKWNSRVTCSDGRIQTQADQMLKLIAEARGRFV